MIQYQAKIQKEDKAYAVVFPDLPGCCSMGHSLKEAKQMAIDALSLYLEGAKPSHGKWPQPKQRKGKNYYWIQPRLNVSIAFLIKAARVRHKLTQAELAKRMGMTAQQIQKLETPGRSNPTIKILSRLSSVLNETLTLQLTA